MLHLFKKMHIAAADLQFFGQSLDLYQMASAHVPDHTVDSGTIDQGGAMNLPEQRRIEFFGQFTDRLANQGLDVTGLHPGIFFV